MELANQQHPALIEQQSAAQQVIFAECATDTVAKTMITAIRVFMTFIPHLDDSRCVSCVEQFPIPRLTMRFVYEIHLSFINGGFVQ
jgi:hypothetical protein